MAKGKFSEPVRVTEMGKNSREKVLFQLAKFGKRDFIDIRSHVIGDNDELIPTKKGIAVGIELWSQFLARINEINEYLVENNFLDKEDLLTFTEFLDA